MYLYYNTQGELLEFINDKSLQQYNGAEYNKLYVYIADEADDGELPSAVTGITTWFERVSGTPIAYGDILAPSAANEQATSILGPTVSTPTPSEIPYDRKRDLKYFVYGKTYQFLVVTMPTEVLNTNGVYAMSAQVIEGSSLGMVLGPAVYTIKKSAILPDAGITTSQFQYLLAQTRKGTAVFEGRAEVGGEVKDEAPFTLESYQNAICVNNDSAQNAYVAKVPDVEVPRAGDLFIYFYDTANINGQKTALFVVDNVSSVVSSLVDDNLQYTVTMNLEAICFLEGKDAYQQFDTVVRTIPQTLTAEQQAQVWTNLGLSDGDIVEY